MRDNFIEKIRTFMDASGQTLGVPNKEQSYLYRRLIEEELYELGSAQNDIEELDAICDSIIVMIGLSLSMGWDIEKALNKCTDNNLTKIVDGKVLKNELGKVIKPANFVPVDLTDCLPSIIYKPLELVVP